MKPILVIGATGTVGREVVRTLQARGEAVRVLVRSKASAPGGVEAVQGNLDDVASLRAAMRGTRGAFFVTANGAAEERHGLAVISMAEELGLERLVYSAAYRYASRHRLVDALLLWLSGVLGPHYRGKLNAGQRLLASKVSHVLLWPTNFFQNDLLVAEPLRAGTYPQAFGSKRVNRVDVRDIALAACRAFTPGLVADGAWPVVGPQALSGEQCAAAWSRALGRPVRYDADPERWVSAVSARLPGPALEDWRKTFKLIARFGVRTPARDLELTTRLLGRPPRTYAQWTLDAAAGLDAPVSRVA